MHSLSLSLLCPIVLLRTLSLSLSLSLFFVYFFFCLLFVPTLCGGFAGFASSLPAGAAASAAGPAAASAAGGGAFSSLNSISLMRLNAFVSSSIMLNPPLKMVKNPPLTFNSPFAILSCTNGNVFTFSTLRRTFSCSNCLNRSSLSYSAQTCFTLSLINPHHASTYPLPSSLLLLLLFFSSSSFDVVVVVVAGGENKLNACAHPPHCACPKTTIASTFSDFTAYSIAAHVPWCAVSAFLSSFFTNGGTTFATFRMVKISPGSALKTSVGSYLLSQH